MRVLVLSDTPFLPPTAGNRQRINQMLDYFLARGIEVGMLMLPAIDAPTWDVPGMQTRLARFELAAPPAALRRTARRVASAARRLARRLRPARSIGVDDWCPPWFRARAAAVVREWHPDVVLVVYVFLSACLERLAGPGGPLRIIDTHDLMHRRRDTYAAAGLAPQWFWTTREEERRGLLRADVVLAISEADADVLRRMVPERTVLAVPHGEPVEPAPSGEAVPTRLLLVASCNDLNVAALRWFLETTWPGLRAAHPALELVVCGTIAEKMSAVPPGVVLRGFVPSLAGEYARARVVVDPIRVATGLQVKLVDALCHGRPLVSAGAAGRAVGAGGGVFVAEDPAELARVIGRLLADDAAWRRACAAAAARAVREFSPEAAFGPLTRHLEAVRAQEALSPGRRLPRH